MFEIFRKKRITKYTDLASEYLEQTFTPEAPPVVPKKESITRFKLDTDLGGSTPSSKDGVKYQKKKTPSSDSGVRYSLRSCDDDDVKYSERKTSDSSITLGDKYDSSAVASLMQKYNLSTTAPSFLKALDNTTNKTFVDTLIIHINKKGMRDSEVYKAAQIDRRLFSKIMSDRQYKPAKDTAIALAIALQLSLDEANDLLSRAGYTFSHSNKKDIIIEYFFRERIYKLDDINQVLFNLDQKIIGR